MSYGFNLIFAKCKSADDILNAYKSIKSTLFDMFKKKIRNNSYIPFRMQVDYH